MYRTTPRLVSFLAIAALVMAFCCGLTLAQQPTGKQTVPTGFTITPIPRGVPYPATIEAVDASGQRLKHFQGQVRITGMVIYTTIAVEEKLAQQKYNRAVEKLSSDNLLQFRNGRVEIAKVEIGSETLTAFFQEKKIVFATIFFPLRFTASARPQGVPISLTIQAVGPQGSKLEYYNHKTTLRGVVVLRDQKTSEKGAPLATQTGPIEITFADGEITVDKAQLSSAPLTISHRGGETRVDIFTFSAWWTIVPPLLAIILAVVTKEVLLSLFIGIWAGVFVISGYHPIGSMIEVVDTYIVATLANRTDYAPVIIFSLTIGGMIGIIARSGGIHDMVQKISLLARTPRSGIIATWAMGVMIFFDDYANTLLVGNSMRPITDKLKISREKLAYIVDSTAAPVTSIAFISTWIGTELGYIGSCLNEYDQGQRAFEYFIASIPYHFYSIFAIIFVFLIGYMLRDFGPMFAAEHRTRTTGEVMAPGANPLTSDEISSLSAPEGKPCRWYNALLPILVVIGVTLGGLYYSGYQASSTPEKLGLREIIQAADSFAVLIWAATWGSMVAAVLALSQRILKISETMAAWVSGVKSMILAMMVLVLAWTLKDLCASMQTNKFIFYSTKDILSVQLLPFLSFIIAAVVAFATGTSWGTMGLLFPFLLPLAIELSTGQKHLSLDANNYIMLGTMGSILAGASFGDHCSPISDTTVMSSMACACDHIDHVKTQMPYALSVGLIACVFGYIPIGFGVPVWISLLLGTVAMVVTLRLIGKKVD